MKKSNPNLLQKMFAGIGMSSSRIPLRSNIFSGGGRHGYAQIGATGKTSYNPDRQSPLLGNAQPSNKLSGYFDRVQELRGYQLLDITKMAISFFKDCIVNFLIENESQLVTILDEEGNNNQQVSDRLNEILSKQLDIIGFIKSHADDVIYYGTYGSLLKTGVDDTGHTSFSFLELYDPVSTVIKRERNKEGETEELCLARGNDGSLYEIPEGEYYIMGAQTLRLINDLSDDWKSNTQGSVTYDKKNQGEKNRDKVIRKESYIAGEPLFYSLILKVKELVIKELLISLISLRDLSTPSLMGLSLDKGVSVEAGNDLCARMQKLTNNYNELASFLSSTFDATSFIETALTSSVKFFPDYNATVSNKSLLDLDKLSSKIMELVQTLDMTRQGILGPLGLPLSLMDASGASGGKWSVLQNSERSQSRVAAIMSGIQDSVVNLILAIYKKLYNEDLDPANVRVHIFEKSTVEYNNQINQAESVNGVVSGCSNLIQSAVQTMDGALGLIDPEKFLTYLQNQLKEIDSTGEFITEDTIKQYVELYNMKLQAQKEQLGMGGGDMM